MKALIRFLSKKKFRNHDVKTREMTVFRQKIGQFWKFTKNLLEFDKTRRNTCLIKISAHLECFGHFMAILRSIFGGIIGIKNAKIRSSLCL